MNKSHAAQFHPRGIPLLFAFLLPVNSQCTLQLPVVSDQPQRVISMAPNLTESIFEIGAGESLVGVTDFCKYPSQARQRQSCGGWSNPDYEVITRLKPDLILIQGRHQSVRDFSARQGIRVCSIMMDDVESITDGLVILGEILGSRDGATSAVTKFENRLAAIKMDLKSHPVHNPPRVFISLSRRPGSLSGIMTMVSGSFIDQALTLAGGENIFNDLVHPYSQVSQENVIVREPEFILEIRGDTHMREESRRDLVDDWSGLVSIPAVRNNRIHVLEADYLLIPGPRFPRTVEMIYEVLYEWGTGEKHGGI